MCSYSVFVFSLFDLIISFASNLCIYQTVICIFYCLRLDIDELRVLAKEFKIRISMLSAKLVKQLKRRAKNAYKLQKNFDVLTAVLQAVSPKRSKSSILSHRPNSPIIIISLLIHEAQKIINVIYSYLSSS